MLKAISFLGYIIKATFISLKKKMEAYQVLPVMETE